MKELTSREKDILEFIIKRISGTGLSPTLREIMLHFGYKAIGTVQDHIASLEKKGFIVKEKRKARSIQPSDRFHILRRSFISVPVLGRIAAGRPVASEENIMGYVPVDFPGREGMDYFALTVSGSSMIEAGIFEGDKAIFEKTSTAKNGDIVAVWVDGETTLKEFRANVEGKILLIPKNKDMKPIEYDGYRESEIVIMGKMVALYRKY